MASGAIALAFAAGGCSYSYKLGALLGEDKPGNNAAAAATTKPAASADSDLAAAKAAATELLAQGGKDISLPWRNPQTGAHGTVTPIASSYVKDGFTCHDFLASHVHGDKQAWYQGDACRMHGGRWEVREIRPLQRT